MSETAMRRFLPTALLILLSVLLTGGLTLLPGSASAARGKKKSASKTTEAPKPLSAYEKLFKGKRVTTVRGFMTLHMYEGNKLYVELPDSLLGREYYRPTEQGVEGKFKARLQQIKAWKAEHAQK